MKRYLTKEVDRYKTDLMTLQEIIWKGMGSVEKKEYMLYYAGGNKQGRNETIFMINKKVKNRISKNKQANMFCI